MQKALSTAELKSNEILNREKEKYEQLLKEAQRQTLIESSFSIQEDNLSEVIINIF